MPGLNPDIANTVSFDDLLSAYASARDALRVGDYESALVLAARENDAALLAVTRIMSGATDYGLGTLPPIDGLDDELKLHVAYGLWCKGDDAAALAVLRAIVVEPQASRARGLESAVGAPATHALIVAYSNFTPDIALSLPGPVRYTAIAADAGVSPADFERALTEAPSADIVIIYGTPPEAMIDRLFAIGVPVVAYTFDTDIYFHAEFDLLRRADAIIVSGAHEFSNCRAVHGGMVASFPGFDLYRDSAFVDVAPGPRDIDVFFSGNLLSPHMAEKSRLVFQLASIDDPSLKISIVDGKLPDPDYRASLRRAKLSPIAFRMSGPIQTRGIDTLRYGADALHIGELPPKLLFRAAADACRPIDSNGLADRVRQYIAAFAGRSQPRSAIADDLLSVMWPSPEREIRMVKFALFQLSVQSPPPKNVRSGPSALDVACRRTAAAFGAFCAAPQDELRRTATANAFAAARIAHPRSLILAFNQACYAWIANDRAAALSAFHVALDLIGDGVFEPGRQSLMSYRLLAAREFMPYQIFWEAVMADYRHGLDRLPGARIVIAATARTYLALDRLQANDLDGGRALLERGLADCPTHFPAWRLYAKALAAAGASPDRTRDAVYRAVNLFPPYLTQLLPIGVFCERALGNDSAASMLVTQWAWFFARTHSDELDPARIPKATFDEVRRYQDSLSAALIEAIRRKAPDVFAA